MSTKHPLPSVEECEIGDIPDFDLYKRRRAQLYPDGEPAANLPRRLSARTLPQSAWSCHDLKAEDLVIKLTREDVREVDETLTRLKSTRLHVNEISKDTFVLPKLGSKLRAACSVVTSGKGVVILRGMKPETRCLQDNILVFAGISSYFGNKRGVQGREKDFLVHLRDAGNQHVPDHLRPSPFANQYQAFHTDFCDIIGMYVQQTPVKGGRSYWASTAKIYDEIISKRPHLIEILSDPGWPFQSSVESGQVRLRPILFSSKATNQPFFCFSRTNLTGTSVVPRQPHTQQLSNEQADALDEVHFTAESNAITVEHQQGDMYFLNNLHVLHGREAFEDATGISTETDKGSSDCDSGSEGSSLALSDCANWERDSHNDNTARQRHIMRLWLRNEEYRPDEEIPDLLRPRWEEVFGEDQIGRGKWAFDKVHTKSLIMASLNDEVSSFS